jgi:hypothetical protein
MKLKRALAGVAALALVACAQADATDQPTPIDRLFGLDDVPAGFAVMPLTDPRPPSWCGGRPLDISEARSYAAELLTYAPAPEQLASIQNIVLHFRPGGADRFVAAAIADRTRCDGGVDITDASGLHVQGQANAVPLEDIAGCVDAVEAFGGVQLPDGVSTGGAVSRIIAHRGDDVSIVFDTVAGIDLDSGLRDRLAHLAASQLGAEP